MTDADPKNSNPDESDSAEAFSTEEFPELPPDDQFHLQRQYRMHGKDRVIGWLKAKVTLPTRLELAQLNGESVDEDRYYEELADHYITTQE